MWRRATRTCGRATFASSRSSALTSGEDGLDLLRAIVGEAPARLRPGGWLLLEHGYDQGEAVPALLGAAGLLHVFTERDLAGLPRVSGARMVALA